MLLTSLIKQELMEDIINDQMVINGLTNKKIAAANRMMRI